MSKFKLHPKQQEAVEALGTNVIVSASAGAGKTSVLIQRLMKRILIDGLSVNEICALTFTEAAAGDMKIKLLESLHKKLQEKDLDEHSKKVLETEISLVETAAITTIHSFCLTIIKNYGYILNIDPARADNILDPAMSEIYKKEALEQTLQEVSSKRVTATRKLLHHLITNPTYLIPLEESILKTAEYLNSKPDIESTVENIQSLYTAQSFSELPDNIQHDFFRHYHLALTILQNNLDYYIDQSYFAFESEGKLELLSPYKKLQDDVYNLLKLVEAKDINFYDHMFKVLDVKLKSAPKAPELKADLKALTDSIESCIKYYKPLNQHFQIIHSQKEILDFIIDLALIYLNKYDKIKEDEGVFDFDDFEKYALKILQHNDSYIAKLMQENYKEIMVDEFQDTNDYQDSIIKLMSTGDNIFRVGDVKQSIYQFRGAKPELMMNYLKSKEIHKIPFMVNYRSSHNIVHYNNDLYTKLMSFTEDFHYTEDDTVSAGNFNALLHNPMIDFKLYTTSAYEEENGVKLYAQDINRYRAQIMGNEIIKLTEDGSYQYKDITILIRTHAAKINLKEAFEMMNIPHFIDDLSGFFKSETVNQVLAWLHYSVNQDPYYLISVLKSPFIAYSDDDIARLKIHNEDIKESLKFLDQDTYTLIHEKVKAYQTQDLVSVLIDLYNIDNTYHEKLSLQVKTNLDLLLEKAIHYQENNHSSLIGFTRFAAEIDDERNTEAVPLNDEENVVRVMTWHQSKGLQYPVTLLWPTARINQQDFRSRILSDDEYGLTLKDLHTEFYEERSSLYRMLAESKQTQAAVEEYLRLLYVATTRAEQKLIFVDVLKDVPTKPLSKHLLYNFSSSTELIFPVQSQYIEKTVHDIRFFEPVILDTVKEEKIQNVFTKRFDERFTVEKTPYQDSKFSFNKNFIHSVAYGNTLHQAVENLPDRDYTLEDLKDIEPQYHQKLLNYNTHPFTQLLYTAIKIEHEMPILYREASQDFQGIIDFYAIFSDRVIIVDYKTDAVDETTLIERYTSQLQAYKKALETIYPKLDIETYIYSFNLDDYIELTDDTTV